MDIIAPYIEWHHPGGLHRNRETFPNLFYHANFPTSPWSVPPLFFPFGSTQTLNMKQQCLVSVEYLLTLSSTSYSGHSIDEGGLAMSACPVWPCVCVCVCARSR